MFNRNRTRHAALRTRDSRRRRLVGELLEPRRLLAAGLIVQSILRRDANPTKAEEVSFGVQFDEEVTGVDSTDFLLELSGVSGASISQIAGSGANYTVSISTGSGDGTLKLNLIDNDSIRSTQNNPQSLDGSYSQGESYTIDKTAPTTAGPTIVGTPGPRALTIDLNVTFSEIVSNVDSSDFALSGTGTSDATILSVSGSGSSYVVQVGTGSGEGDLQLNLLDDDSIVDAVGNPLGGFGTQTIAGETHSVDHLAPAVLSIEADRSSPTNAELIVFGVTFNESVMEVGLEDFELITTGIDDAIISNISGSGSQYAVTVSTGTGDGSVKIAMASDATISDLAGNTMPASSVSSPVITIDKTLPAAISIERIAPTATTGNSVQYIVNYSEPIFGVTPDAYIVVTSPTATSPLPITDIHVDGDMVTVTVSVADYEGSVYLHSPGGGDIVDAAGNVLARTGVTSNQFHVDRTPPEVTGVELEQATVTNLPNVSFLVTFSEIVNSFTISDVALDQVGLPGANVTSIEHVSGTQKRVHVSTGVGEGTLSIDVLANKNAKDLVNLKIATPSDAHPSYSVDTLAPTITAINRLDANPSKQATVRFELVFSEPVQGVDLADFALTTDISDASLVDLTGSGTTYTITANTGSTSGVIGLGLSAIAAITDDVGNAIAGTTVGTPYTIDRTPPSVLSISRSTASPTSELSLGFDIDFSESVTGVTASSFSVTAVGVTGGTISSVVGSGSSYVVTVTHNGEAGTIGISLIDTDAIIDAAGNPLGGVGCETIPGPTYTVETKRILGRVVEDLDRSGTAEPGEPGVAGQTLYLDLNDNRLLDTGEPSTVSAEDDSETAGTDETGHYRFEDLRQGTYILRWLENSAWEQSPSLADTGVVVQLVASDGDGQAEYPLANLAPDVSSITTDQTATVTQGLVTYQVTFDEPVTGVDATDFTVASNAVSGVLISSVTGGGQAFIVTLDTNGSVGQGYMTLQIDDDDSIVDDRSLPLGNVGLRDNVVESPAVFVDRTDPIVESITAVNSPIINDDDAVFIVIFNEPVIGVNTSDFTISAAGVSSSSVLSVQSQSGGKTFHVTVDSGSGDGTIQLLLIDDQTIVDAVGRPLGGVVEGAGDFTTGDVVPVERNPLRNITGALFDDANHNGVRDIGEAGAGGGAVYLDLNSDGTFSFGEPSIQNLPFDDLSTTDIDEGGSFTFVDQPLGTYRLAALDRLAFVESVDHPITVDLGYEDDPLTVDVPALRNETAFRGIVYEDLNQNAIRDLGEPRIAGRRVYLDSNSNETFDSFEDFVLTSANDPSTSEDESGAFEFSPLEFEWDDVGSRLHVLRLESDDHWLSTSPELRSVAFETPDQVELFDFGLTENLTSISGVVFEDLDASGTRTADEAGQSNWTVFLDENNDGVWNVGEQSTQTSADDPSTTTVDESGFYEFTTLPLGSHRVAVVVPKEYLSSSGNPVLVSLATSTDSANVDFAARANVTSIAGQVFDDLDGDGVIDAGELGIEGVTVFADPNNNWRIDAGESVATTAADGSYRLEHVTPGSQIVRIVTPRAHEVTSPSNLQERVFLWHGSSSLREIDPLTGGEIKETVFPSAEANARSLAFDGSWLWTISTSVTTGSINQLLKIHPDSHEIVLEKSISATGTFSGVAALSGAVLAIDTSNDRLYRFDAATGDLTDVFDLATVNSGSPYVSGTLDLSGAAGETADGSAMMLETTNGRWLIVDPATGEFTGHVDYLNNSSDGFSGGTGSIYVAEQTTQQVLVYDSQGNLLRTMNVDCGPNGMASGFYLDTAQRFDILRDETVDNVNFGARVLGGNVTGTQFDDLNGNGVQEVGEVGLAGVVVFADSNGNGWPDADEAQTVSAADGSYTLVGVETGTVTVRAISPEHYRASRTAPIQNRLFAVQTYANDASPSGFSLGIAELNLATGAVVAFNPTDIHYGSARLGLAFDGQRLILTDSTANMFYELAIDGTVLESRPLGEPIDGDPAKGFTTATDLGPVVVNGSIFTIRLENGLVLYEYDPHSNVFTKRRPITFEWGLESMPVSYQPTMPLADFGVGLSADGQSILVTTTDDRWMTIDPATGTATFDPAPQDSGQGTDYAIDSVSGVTFVAFSGGRILVYDGQGAMIREMNGLPTFFALGGGEYHESGETVEVVLNQTSHASFGHQTTLGSLSGTVSTDADRDQTVDVGEEWVFGATIYLDTNGNDQLDPGEPQTVTSATGEYTFAGLAPGEYIVRQVAPSGQLTQAWTDDYTRLFAYVKDPSSDAVIQERDPITGEVLRQFAAPVPTATAIGLALHEDRLYLTRGLGVDVLDANSGELLGTIPLPTATLDGLAIIGSRAFVSDYYRNLIYVVDLHTRRLVRQLDLGLINHDSPGSIDIGFSLAEAADGVNLAVVEASSDDLLIVDPETGLILETLTGSKVGRGSAGAGGELYDLGSRMVWADTKIDVQDHLGLHRRNVPLGEPHYIYGLAAESVSAVEHRVRLYAEQDVSGLHFGNFADSGAISGVQFVDANQNGTLDVGELPLAGVTVFVDLNANDWPESNEPSATSGMDGTYTIANVPLGQHRVRTIAPHHRPTVVTGTSDRLVGVSQFYDASSPTEYRLRIFELDPATGSLLVQRDTSVAIQNASSAAYDGERLFVVDNDADKLYELTIDGSVIDATPLPAGTSSSNSMGPVVIDGTVYLVNIGSATPEQLFRFDPELNAFYGATPISRWTGEGFVHPTFSAAFSESPDGKSILAFSKDDSRILVIDPLTARVTRVVDLQGTGSGDYTAATVGGELFVRSAEIGGITQVYDASYNLIRTMPGGNTSGMGGAAYTESGVVVDVTGVAPVNLNTGYVSELTTISGTALRDVNGNGTDDGNEEPDAGATLFLDSNRNGLLDVGELTTTTLADGTYAFEGLVPGDYVVRRVESSGMRNITTATETALYELDVATNVPTIRKVDALSGQVLREFSAPGISNKEAGLAVDGFGLYYSSPEGVWILDHDSGEIRDFIDLPNAPYHGLAAIDGYVYAVNASADSIVKINPHWARVVTTFDINAINGTSYNLEGNLGESTDGFHLITRMPTGGGLLINPQTGIVEHWFAYNSGASAIAGAGGELYWAPQAAVIRVDSESEALIRHINVPTRPYGIAAAVLPAEEYLIRAAEDVHFGDLDFLVTSHTGVTPSSIAGTVWADENQSGTRDPGEAGLAEIVVYLDLNANGTLEPDEPRQLTQADDVGTVGIDEAGNYKFQDLLPGDYEVRQLELPSYVATTPTVTDVELDQRYPTDFQYVGFQHNPDDDLRLSADGRYLVYSTIRQVLPADTNSRRDIYWLDRSTGQSELISINTAGVQGNANHFEPDVSADGRYVIFRSGSTNFDPADTDGNHDIYIRDRELGTTALLTLGSSTAGAGGFTADAVISPDGQRVLFYTLGGDLIAGDTNARHDTYLLDRSTGDYERISVTASGAQLTDEASYGGDMSADGRYVIFESKSSQLVPGDTNGLNDIFWKDRSTGEVRLVSASSSGVAGNGQSRKRSMSDDGRWVVFDSNASNLTNDPHPGPGQVFHVYLKDMVTAETTRISVSPFAGSELANSRRPEISGDGRFIVFESDGQLVAEDTSPNIDVYMYDREEGTMHLVSRRDDGYPSRGESNNPVISADGSTIAFTTWSSNILGVDNVGGIVTAEIRGANGAYHVQLDSGTESAGIDFGQALIPAEINGQLWRDDNENGAADAGEPFLAGRTVFVDLDGDRIRDADEPYQLTASDDSTTSDVDETGRYRFTELAAGSYAVVQELPADWEQTVPDERSADIQLIGLNGYVGGQNNGTLPHYDSAISDDGRWIAFTTPKSMLPADTNTVNDLYVYDTVTQLITLESVSNVGMTGNGTSYNPSISEDGRYVTFRSEASNFVSRDFNNTFDIFVRDRELVMTTLVSENMDQSSGNSYSFNPQISGDGRFISFWSNASNLVAGDTNGLFDLFLRDLEAGTTKRINLAADGQQATGGNTHESQLSRDGRYVVYWSHADNLVPGDTNGVADVFHLDRMTGVVQRVSTSSSGAQSDADSGEISVSDDGRYVSFRTSATTLSELSSGGRDQIYVKDVLTGQLTMISQSVDAQPGNGGSLNPSISGDGRFISFDSAATNLVAGDTNGQRDVFIHDRVTGATTRISRSPDGSQSNGRSDYARISRDGSTVVFNSAADNLLASTTSEGGLYAVSVDAVLGLAVPQRVDLLVGEIAEDVNFGSTPDLISPQVPEVVYGDPDSQSVIREIVVSFDELVEIDDGAFTLTNLDDGSLNVAVAVAIDESGGTTVATLTFSGSSVDSYGTLIDGNYRLTILDTHIRDRAGNALDGDQDGVGGGTAIDDFFRYFGDYDGDRDVDATDFSAMLSTYRKRSGQDGFSAAFDSDGDGDVDATDFSFLLQHYRTRLS